MAADHTKWGVVGLSSIARLDEAQVLITDSGLPHDARETLAKAVPELVIVDQNGRRTSAHLEESRNRVVSLAGVGVLG